jgi:hypothetical protein
MIVNATRSRTQSPLQTLGAQTFYTMLEEPFYGGSPLLLSVMYNVATCSSLIR